MRDVEYLSRRYFQLMSRHTVMGTYLHRIERVETDQCWKCTTPARIGTNDILFDCSLWTKVRSEMRKKWEVDSGG